MLTAVVLGGYCSTAAYAQPVPSTPTATAASTPVTLEPFEVTGSNIKRVDYEGPAIVTVIDRAAIERSGATTVAELMKQVPGNFSSIVTELRSNPPRANASASLRGLGGAATLVLLNGRRVAASAYPSRAPAPNLNNLPMGAIERVEILKDGASAIYGSDAIAGVINFITRKDYDGTVLTLGYNNTFDSDMGEFSANLTSGGRQGKFHGVLSLDYYTRNALMDTDRPLHASSDQRSRGGSDGRSTTGNPGAVVIVDTSGASPYRAANAATATATRPANGRWVIPTVQAVPGRPTIQEFINAGTVGNTGAPRFDLGPDVQLFPETDRYGIVALGGYDLTPKVELYTDLSYNLDQTELALAAVPVSTAISPQIIVPATHFANPFGEALILDYRPTELGLRIHEQEMTAWRTLAGVRGRFAETWSWDTAVMVTRSKYEQTGRNFTSTGAIQAAVNDPNPATALNPFLAGPGQNPATIAALRVTPWQDWTVGLDVWDFKFSGDVLALPAGPLAMAVGGEARHEEYTPRQDALSARGEIIGVATAAYDGGDRDAQAAFVEFSVPVFKSLELQLAARHERYSDFGNTTKPKAALRFRPIKDVLLRASYSEGFRAPALQQLYASATRGFPRVRDTTRYNITGAPEDNSSEYPEISGGNRNLRPEESASVSAGILYEPSFVSGLTLGADFFNIRFNNIVSTVGTQALLDRPTLFPQVIVTRDASTALPGVANSGRIQSIFNPLLNIGHVEVEGFDFEARYVWRSTELGTFTVASTSTRLSKFMNQPTPAVTAVDHVHGVDLDDSARPRWRATSSIAWERKKLGVVLQWNHVGSYSTRAGAPSSSDRPVDSWNTFDAQGTYTLDDRTDLTLGVRNLTDEPPPFYNRGTGGIYGFDPSAADPRGANYYLRIRRRF